MFEAQFSMLTNADQNEFKRIVNVLFLKSFVVRDQFDSKEKAMRINPDYRFIERFFDLINAYLAFSNWYLEKDVINGVYSLINENETNRIRIDRETSLILFTLRLMYESEKKEGAQTTSSVYMATPNLLKEMLGYGITMSGKRLTGRLIGRSLRTLATHNIIAKVSGSYDEGNVNFYILPSIIYAVDNQKIVEMEEAIRRMNLDEGSPENVYDGGEMDV